MRSSRLTNTSTPSLCESRARCSIGVGPDCNDARGYLSIKLKMLIDYGLMCRFGRGTLVIQPHTPRSFTSVVQSGAVRAQSRGRHGLLQPLHGAGTEADEFGGLEHACALGELAACVLELLRVGSRAPESLALLAGLADEMTVACDSIPSTG